MQQLRMEVEAEAQAARLARRRFHTWLSEVQCPVDSTVDAVLVFGELIDNAIAHARSTAVVDAVFEDGRLRIEVYDADPRPPVLREPGPAGGFGLRIVAASSDDWGWSTTGDGKRIWVELLC